MEKKKQRIYAIITLVTLALLVVGTTYAYFQNQYGESSQTDVKVTTYTTDLLTFETGDAINITADQESFAQGKGNQTGSSFAKAILQANSKTNEATSNYYIYLNIESNKFTYTSEDNKAELVLQVTDNSGNPVTSIDGLTYVTVVDGSGTSISGFDITEKKGLITLVNNKEISASPKTEEQYNISLVLVNYDFDQNNNAGKNFNAKLMIQKEKEKETISMVCSNGQNLSDCIKSMNGKDETLYYHDSSLENGAGDNSYRYAGADYLLTNAGKALGVTNIFSTSATDTSGLIDFYCGTSKNYFGGYCSLSSSYYYLLKNDTTQYTSYYDVMNKAVSNGYVMENINNYVCFGLDDATCSVDNLYRIIGVFDNRVKLIKADYAASTLLGIDGDYIEAYSNGTTTYKGSLSASDIGAYKWNHNKASNTWSTCLLNKTNLNTNYLNNIGSKWSEMIDTTTWKVGGNTSDKISKVIPSVAYQNEILNPVTKYSTDNATEYSAKVGLMYASDFGFAVDPSAWTSTLYNYDSSSIRDNNWMYMGLFEFTISRSASGYSAVFFVSTSGRVNYSGGYYCAARPVFFLSSSVNFASGDGTFSNPIRLL